MCVVVFAEYERLETAVLTDDRKSVQLMIPDDIVRFLQRNALFRVDQLFKRRHKLRNLRRRIHSRHTVISAGHQTYDLAFRRTVFCHRNGGMSHSLLQRHHIRHRRVRRNIGIALYEARLRILDRSYHSGFILNRLIARK